MKKVTVYQNVYELNEAKNQFQNQVAGANIILNEFRALGFGNIQTEPELNELAQASNPLPFVRKWIERAVTDEQLKVQGAGGFKLSRKAFSEMIETPNLEPLTKAIQENGFNVVWALQLGTINKAGEMVFSDEKFAEFERQKSIYAETAAEIKAFEAAAEMIAAGQKLIDQGAVNPEAFAVSMNRAGITRQNLIDGKLTISEPFCNTIKRKINNLPTYG